MTVIWHANILKWPVNELIVGIVITHTHTHIYIYIYIYIVLDLYAYVWYSVSVRRFIRLYFHLSYPSGACKYCNSFTAGSICTTLSFMELTWPAVVQRHGNWPSRPAWTRHSRRAPKFLQTLLHSLWTNSPRTPQLLWNLPGLFLHSGMVIGLTGFPNIAFGQRKSCGHSPQQVTNSPHLKMNGTVSWHYTMRCLYHNRFRMTCVFFMYGLIT